MKKIIKKKACLHAEIHRFQYDSGQHRCSQSSENKCLFVKVIQGDGVKLETCTERAPIKIPKQHQQKVKAAINITTTLRRSGRRAFYPANFVINWKKAK